MVSEGYESIAVVVVEVLVVVMAVAVNLTLAQTCVAQSFGVRTYPWLKRECFVVVCVEVREKREKVVAYALCRGVWCVSGWVKGCM